MLFVWNFKLHVEWERNKTIIFIFSLSRHFPFYFGLKWCHNGTFEIFCNYFGIFYYTSGRNRTERNDNFYFLSFSPFAIHFYLKKKPLWCFLTFWIFLLCFLEFFITRRVRTERNDNFYFFSFSAFSNLFWLEMKP